MKRATKANSSRVRRVDGPADAASAAALLDRFNREYQCPTPGPEFLARRIEQLEGEQFATFLARDGEEDVGVAVIRFRPALWSATPEGYLAELYVCPAFRRLGLGRELLEATIALAREHRCESVELGTDENDVDAHRLYERLGFSNCSDPAAPEAERQRMLFYELEL